MGIRKGKVEFTECFGVACMPHVLTVPSIPLVCPVSSLCPEYPECMKVHDSHNTSFDIKKLSLTKLPSIKFLLGPREVTS